MSTKSTKTASQIIASLDATDRESLIDALLNPADAWDQASAYFLEHDDVLELTDHGIEVAEALGLRVDVDAYGCAYVVGLELA